MLPQQLNPLDLLPFLQEHRTGVMWVRKSLTGEGFLEVDGQHIDLTVEAPRLNAQESHP